MNKLLLLIGILTLVGGVVFLYMYIGQPDSAEKTNLILGGALSAIALICFAVYFFKKFKEEGDQEISITKF